MKQILSGIVVASLSLLGAQWGMGPGPGTPASSGSCTMGPTTGVTLYMSSDLSTGTVTTWTPRVGTVTATAAGGGTITNVASIFGSVPGVRFTSANSQYMTLSGAVDTGSNNNTTVMVVWKPASLSSGVSQYFTGCNAGCFAYSVANPTLVQSAVSQNVAVLGYATDSLSAGNVYNMNVQYEFGSSILAFRLNKSSDMNASTTLAATGSNITQLFAADAGGTESSFVDGWVAAILIENGNFPGRTTDVQTWENYFSCEIPGA